MKQKNYFSTYLELFMMPCRAWVKLGRSLTLAVLRIVFFNPMTKVLWLSQPHHYWIILVWGTVSSRNILSLHANNSGDWQSPFAWCPSTHLNFFQSQAGAFIVFELKKIEQSLNYWHFFLCFKSVASATVHISSFVTAQCDLEVCFNTAHSDYSQCLLLGGSVLSCRSCVLFFCSP